MSTNRQSRVDVRDRGLERRRLPQIVELTLDQLARARTLRAAERLTDDERKGLVVTGRLRVKLAELQLHPVHKLIETEPPVELVEVSLVALERPAETLLEA